MRALTLEEEKFQHASLLRSPPPPLNLSSAQMLVVTVLGVETVLRLKRDVR